MTKGFKVIILEASRKGESGGGGCNFYGDY